MIKGVSLLCVQICLFCIAFEAQAATLYMNPNNVELKRGDTVKVSVQLDTDEGECVNVVDAVITYSDNIQPVDTSRGESIFSLWVEEPAINKEDRTITFAGGIPNGYCGRIPGDPQLTNTVVDLLFASPGLQIGSSESGNIASINFSEETHVLLNDGFGTSVQPQLYGASITLAREAGSTVTNPWQEAVSSDTVPPEAFSATLERTPNAHSNKYFIVFNTTDKQSGIDHYEVIEEPLASQNLFGWGAATAPWVVAKSPYVLDDQTLNSTIRVKAIDKAGNEYVATVVPEVSLRTTSDEHKVLFAVGITLVLVLGLAVAFGALLLHRRIRKTGQTNEPDEEII